ncbi:DUF2742 domain-containing protein [Lentzea rhizosphaerae]|uniref:DUF2742 domain-containing protein n=1 Tax=Lentzea rhizosphaerae TaxID=2041025 RepID=A0ABV8BSN8_9PSEU
MTTDRRPLCDPQAVRLWAVPLLTRAQSAGVIPPAGSRAWCALDDTDPRKPAAVVLAALTRLEENTPAAIDARRTSRLDEIERVCRDRARSASHDMSATQAWGSAIGPSFKELERRRLLTSTLPCGHLGCTAVVEFVHPLPDELAARLPDVSSVRCPQHLHHRAEPLADNTSRRLAVAA